MRSLVLDQSSTCCGFALLEAGQLVDHGVIKPRGKDLLDRSLDLWKDLRLLILQLKVDELVIEDTKYIKQRSADTAKALANIMFVCEMVARESRIPIYKQNPMTIKRNVTGKGNADKAVVIHAVCQYYGFARQQIIDDNHADAIAGALSWKVDGARIRAEYKGGILRCL